MSDLNAFFAKKDRRKRRSKSSKPTLPNPIIPTTGSPGPTLTQLTAGVASTTANEPIGVKNNNLVPEEGKRKDLDSSLDEAKDVETVVEEKGAEVQKKRDDGWVELEEEGTAQVHTGGRTILELKKGEEKVEDNEEEVEDMTEKFSGWQSKAEEDTEEVPDEGDAEQSVDESKFPTLAETKHAPLVPPSAGKYGHSSEIRPKRPYSTKFSGLQKLAERLKEQNEDPTKKMAGKPDKVEGASKSNEAIPEEPGNARGVTKNTEFDNAEEAEAPKSSLQKLMEKKSSADSAGARRFPGLKGMLKARSAEKKVAQ